MTTLIIKIYFSLLFAIFGFNNSNITLQETFDKEVVLKTGQMVRLDLKFASDIIVTNSNSNKLSIKATVIHNFKEKLDFQLLEENEKDEVLIEEKIKNLEDRKYTKHSENDSNCIDLKIEYIISLPSKTELNIHSISGNIEVKNMKNALELETISGFIDVSINNSDSYDLKCSTISGSIYSDLQFNKKNLIKQDIVGSKIETSINNGGKNLKMQTISGDLFLRKK